jgi:hypothetical protein
VSGQYGRGDEPCPVSTGGGTSRVRLVRGGGGGGGVARRTSAPLAGPARSRRGGAEAPCGGRAARSGSASQAASAPPTPAPGRTNHHATLRSGGDTRRKRNQHTPAHGGTSDLVLVAHEPEERAVHSAPARAEEGPERAEAERHDERAKVLAEESELLPRQAARRQRPGLVRVRVQRLVQILLENAPARDRDEQQQALHRWLRVPDLCLPPARPPVTRPRHVRAPPPPPPGAGRAGSAADSTY